MVGFDGCKKKLLGQLMIGFELDELLFIENLLKIDSFGGKLFYKVKFVRIFVILWSI